MGGVPPYFSSPVLASRSGGRGEAEVAQHEPLRERVERADRWLAELLLDEIGARLLVAVRDGHAARVVDEHAEKVLLRDRGPQDQRWSEQAEQEQEEERQADGDEIARSRGWPSLRIRGT